MPLRAQDYIVKKNNDTIWCKITKVTSMNIFYTEKKVGKSINKTDVINFSQLQNSGTDSIQTAQANQANINKNKKQKKDSVTIIGKNFIYLMPSRFKVGISYERRVSKLVSVGTTLIYRKQIIENDNASGNITLLTPYFCINSKNTRGIPNGLFYEAMAILSYHDDVYVSYGPWKHEPFIGIINGATVVEKHCFTAFGFGIGTGYKYLLKIGKRYGSICIEEGFRKVFYPSHIPQSVANGSYKYSLSTPRLGGDAPLSLFFLNISVGFNF